MKRKWPVVLGAVVLAAALCLWGTGLLGRRPFRGLTADEVAAASVRLLPPDRELALGPDEISQLVQLLNRAVIYQRDDSFSDYDGQAVLFTLTMQDGTQCEINAYNPFLVIDGKGYRCAYEPCEALSQFANDCLRRHD